MSQWFWNGLWHPLWATSHVLCLIALALFSVQHGKLGVRAVWFGVLPSLILGLVLTHFISIPHGDYYLLSGTVIIGLLVAARPPKLPLAIITFLALLSGLVIGLESIAPTIPGVKAWQMTEYLIAVGVSCCMMLGVAQLIAWFLNKPWQGLAVRILGAWLTAGAGMVLALLLIGPLPIKNP